MSAQGGDAAAAQQNNPALVQLQAKLLQLQTQFTTLQTTNTSMATQLNALQAAPAATHAAAAQAVAIVFALMPAMSNLTGLIDFASKLGMMVYKEGCKKLSDNKGFLMTPATTSAFVKAFNNRCNIMGWNQGTQGITSHAKATGVIVDIVKAYGQINKTTLKTHCNDFCKAGGANFQNRAAQNNHMMAQCLTNSLTPALGAGSKRRLSFAKWHKNGKQCPQLHPHLGARPVQKDHPVQCIGKHPHFLHFTADISISCLCFNLHGTRGSPLPEGARPPSARPSNS
jgi:hypothetical protein